MIQGHNAQNGIIRPELDYQQQQQTMSALQNLNWFGDIFKPIDKIVKPLDKIVKPLDKIVKPIEKVGIAAVKLAQKGAK